MLNLLMNVNKLYLKNALNYASHGFALNIKTEQALCTLKYFKLIIASCVAYVLGVCFFLMEIFNILMVNQVVATK